MNSFIVANGLNTSYIDSLLIALFYSQTHLKSFLNQCPENIKFIYLQELINDNFIDNAKNGYFVDSSVINEIRNYSIVCGWKDQGQITDLYSVLDYFKFLMAGFGFGQIDIELVEYDKNENEQVTTLSLNVINLNVMEDNDVKTLLDDWVDIFTISKKENTLIIGNRFKEIPFMIPIYFNRQGETSYKIDIKKKIKFKKNSDQSQNKMTWIIHSLICFSNSGGGNYYSVINTGNYKWKIFTNERQPSIMSIDFNDVNTSNKIKQECIMAIYRLE